LPKYNSIETIPARIFFEILKSNNLQLLKPKPSEQGLEEVFMSIYDEYFLKSENYQANEFLTLKNQIGFLNYKIAVIKSTLHFIFYNKTTKKMRLDIIKALKVGCDIEIDSEKPFIEEVKRVLEIEIGILQNELSILNIDYENIIKENKDKDFDYYDRIGVLSQVLPNNSLIKENMTLAVHIALEKLANKQNKKK
jgi:hypothetical protein